MLGIMGPKMLLRAQYIIYTILGGAVMSWRASAYALNPQSEGYSLVPSSGTWDGNNCNFMTGEFKASCFPEYIVYLIQLIFMFISGFFLLMLILAGYQLAIGSLTGARDAGKERLRWAIAGFIIAGFSFLIVSFIIWSLYGDPSTIDQNNNAPGPGPGPGPGPAPVP